MDPLYNTQPYFHNLSKKKKSIKNIKNPKKIGRERKGQLTPASQTPEPNFRPVIAGHTSGPHLVSPSFSLVSMPL